MVFFVSLQKDKTGKVLSAMRHTIKNCTEIPLGQDVRNFPGGVYYRQNLGTIEGIEEHKVEVELCSKCFYPENYTQEYIKRRRNRVR